MARTRKPTTLLEQNGAFNHNPQRREARECEPIPSGPLGDPPVSFTAVQKAIWREIELQVPEGVLTIADRMLVEIYCALVARHRGGDPDPDPEAECRIKLPEILKSSEYNLIISILSRMGLTPADRSRIKATPSEKEKSADDTFDRLAREGRGRARSAKAN